MKHQWMSKGRFYKHLYVIVWPSIIKKVIYEKVEIVGKMGNKSNEKLTFLFRQFIKNENGHGKSIKETYPDKGADLLLALQLN